MVRMVRSLADRTFQLWLAPRDEGAAEEDDVEVRVPVLVLHHLHHGGVEVAVQAPGHAEAREGGHRACGRRGRDPRLRLPVDVRCARGGFRGGFRVAMARFRMLRLGAE